jgi:DNA primase
MKELIFLKLSAAQKQYLASAAQHYARSLHTAEGYLAQRGLTLADGATAHLGVVADPLPGHEQYRGRLAIPYVTRTGVADIRFRSIGDQEPKYLGLPGAKTHLYNVMATFEATNSIALCEGEIDTLTLHYKCGIPAVGVPGVSNWKKHYNRILQDFETVYVFADGDQPGQDFAKHISREIGFVTVIQMPDGEDVNSIYCKQGPGAIREKLGLHV